MRLHFASRRLTRYSRLTLIAHRGRLLGYWPFEARHLRACAGLTQCKPLLGLQRHFASTSRPHRLKTFGNEPTGGDPTIYALSTAPGRAAIAIIRISGPACLHVHRCLCPGKSDPKPRVATVRSLYEPDTGNTIDSILDSSALVLYFPSPQTVTGEDVLELHVHGGPAIVKAVLAAISKCSTGSNSIRYAEPGEFTRRAFLNGRLDLTQVEALGDSLSAATEKQRRLSVRGTGGQLAKQYEAWRHDLLYARGELEALIDFSEDQHFDESATELCDSVAVQVRSLVLKLSIHRENAVRGELLRNGISIALLGAPNVGKSSLLNCIVGRDAAIVSHEAGTTRDVVEVGIDLGGYFCRIGDTAGLRRSLHQAKDGIESQAVVGQVEQEGMRRAKQRANESDIVIVLCSFDADGSLELDEEVARAADEFIQARSNVVVVVNKLDYAADCAGVTKAQQRILSSVPELGRDQIYFISCKNAQGAIGTESSAARNTTNISNSQESSTVDRSGLQTLLAGLVAKFDELTAAVTADGEGEEGDIGVWQESLGASERHRLLLNTCHGHLCDFLEEVSQAEEQHADEPDIVVAAEHLRAAADCLAKITGRGQAGDVEEVLGVVFEKFCVGK